MSRMTSVRTIASNIPDHELYRASRQAAGATWAIAAKLSSMCPENAQTSGVLQRAFGYQGDPMNLPVRDVAAALPFYETVLGFRVRSRTTTPLNRAVLARDEVEIALVENGGDPSQDG